jgi:heterotetrameric sarcosine oxidase gamma subunit
MGYNAKIRRQGTNAVFDIKGVQAKVEKYAGASLPSFPKAANTVTVKDDVSLLHIGRNHWLAHAPLDQEAILDNALRPTGAPADISIIRISDTLSFFSVSGPDADQVMTIATPLDIHPQVFPDTGATFTEIFGLKGLIIRQKDGFLIAVEQSYGDMIKDYFSRATA